MSVADFRDPIQEGRFQIFLRRRQLQANYPPPDGEFQNVVVQCDPLTGAAVYIPGTVDNTGTWWCDSPINDHGIEPVQDYNGDWWYDFSNFIEGQEGLQFTWDKWNNSDSQAVNKDGSNYDKGITSDLIFRDCAFHFLYHWLLTNECQILNFIEVKIVDLISRGNGGTAADPQGNYRIFEIKSDNLEYAPIDEPCVFRVKLREQDETWHCIHKTVIWDNWQGWFGGDGTTPTREFPQFFTCIEPRPRLLSSARMGLMIFWESLFVQGIPIIGTILWFLNKEGLRAHARRIMNADKFVDAPQVYDYILNVAMKCDMDTDTVFDPGQPLFPVCIYFPSAGQLKEFDDTCNDCDPVAPDLFFTYDNRWLITLADLLDKLKVVFAAEWYVTPNNRIVFKFAKDLIQLAPIYDYTADGAEPIYGLKYTFNGDKKPAYGRYQYQVDGSDLASQEMDTLYNDIVDFDGSAFNPMLEGDKTKNFEFGTTGFVGDGRSKNYMKLLIKDGHIVALILMAIMVIAAAWIAAVGAASLGGGGIIGLGIVGLTLTWLSLIESNRVTLKQEFVQSPRYKGAVRLTCEQVATPRLLWWDEVSKEKAMVEARVGYPVPFPYYNPPTATYPDGIPYNVANQISIDNDGNPDNGTFGIYNYSLYFDSMYYDNLFIRYHDSIDNPLKSIETHQQARFYVDLCVDQLNLYGVFQNQYAQIGKVVKVEKRDGYDVYVRIGNINVDYKSNQIVITGTVIRKPSANADNLRPGNTPVEIPLASGLPPSGAGTGICFKWKNQGTQPVTVTYYDCLGELITDELLLPGQRICALEVVASDPETLILTDSCDSGAGSGSVSMGSGLPDFPCVPKIYRAAITPAFIDDGTPPSVIVYENTIGDIVWTRDSAGVYYGTLAGAFPFELTWYQGNNPIPPGQGYVDYRILAPDIISIETYDWTTAPSDFVSGESHLDIEVIVYCPPVVNCQDDYPMVRDWIPDPLLMDIGSNITIYNIPGVGTDVVMTDWPSEWSGIDGYEDNGDGTYNLVFYWNTPDHDPEFPEGDYNFFFTINGCEFQKTIHIYETPPYLLQSYILFNRPDLGLDGSTFQPRFFFDGFSWPETGFIYWGDGRIEAFSQFSTFTLSHTYDPDLYTSAPVIVFFNQDDLFDYDLSTEVANGITVSTELFSTNMTPLATHFYNACLSAGFDLSNILFPSSVVVVDMQNSLDQGVTIPYAGGFVVPPNCTVFDAQLRTAPVSWVNDVLIQLDANGLSNGICDLTQSTIPAAPTGAGLTAKANLISKGWTVTTD